MLETTEIGPPTDLAEKREMAEEGLVPAGYEHDPYSPDEFVIRCTDCGVLDRVDARDNAHRRADSHTLDCHNQTGVTPISQVAPERPAEGDIATVTYRSRRSNRTLTAKGPVIRFETIETAGQVIYEVHLQQQTSDYDRTVVARYQPDSDREFVARSITESQTTTIGRVHDVEYTPVMTDGGQDTHPTPAINAPSGDSQKMARFYQVLLWPTVSDSLTGPFFGDWHAGRPQKLCGPRCWYHRVRVGSRSYSTAPMFDSTPGGDKAPEQPRVSRSDQLLVATLGRSPVLGYTGERVVSRPDNGLTTACGGQDDD